MSCRCQQLADLNFGSSRVADLLANFDILCREHNDSLRLCYDEKQKILDDSCVMVNAERLPLESVTQQNEDSMMTLCASSNSEGGTQRNDTHKVTSEITQPPKPIIEETAESEVLYVVLFVLGSMITIGLFIGAYFRYIQGMEIRRQQTEAYMNGVLLKRMENDSQKAIIESNEDEADRAENYSRAVNQMSHK